MMKKVLITGGTRGIGQALVVRFLKEGFHVMTCGSSSASVENLKTLVPSPFLQAAVVDISKKAEIEKWISDVLLQHPEVDILINNAGRFIPGSVGEEPEGAFEEMIATNLASAYYATRALLPSMKARRKGHVFNICSTASITAYTNGGSYCISKFGLLGMSKVLREELKESNIKVTAVLPGATLTDSWAGSHLPETRFMKPEDVADIIWATYSLSPSAVVEEILLRPVLGDIV